MILPIKKKIILLVFIRIINIIFVPSVQYLSYHPCSKRTSTCKRMDQVAPEKTLQICQVLQIILFFPFLIYIEDDFYVYEKGSRKKCDYVTVSCRYECFAFLTSLALIIHSSWQDRERAAQASMINIIRSHESVGTAESVSSHSGKTLSHISTCTCGQMVTPPIIFLASPVLK